MGGPVVEGAFAGCCRLHGEAKKGDHCEAGVLDLGQLQGRLLLRVGSEAEGVEELAPRVEPLFRVELRVPLELDVPDHEHLDPYQRRYGERQRLSQVG